MDSLWRLQQSYDSLEVSCNFSMELDLSMMEVIVWWTYKSANLENLDITSGTDGKWILNLNLIWCLEYIKHPETYGRS